MSRPHNIHQDNISYMIMKKKIVKQYCKCTVNTTQEVTLGYTCYFLKELQGAMEKAYYINFFIFGIDEQIKFVKK